jgi:hypothetical protein
MDRNSYLDIPKINNGLVEADEDFNESQALRMGLEDSMVPIYNDDLLLEMDIAELRERSANSLKILDAFSSGGDRLFSSFNEKASSFKPLEAVDEFILTDNNGDELDLLNEDIQHVNTEYDIKESFGKQDFQFNFETSFQDHESISPYPQEFNDDISTKMKLFGADEVEEQEIHEFVGGNEYNGSLSDNDIDDASYFKVDPSFNWEKYVSDPDRRATIVKWKNKKANILLKPQREKLKVRADAANQRPRIQGRFCPSNNSSF